jgi:hypothetical protein
VVAEVLSAFDSPHEANQRGAVTASAEARRVFFGFIGKVWI